MSSVNVKLSRPSSLTFEGARVPSISNEKKLQRLVLANMLWESQFYMDGVSTADLIKDLVAKVSPSKVEALARKARSEFKLRHVPLLLARSLAAIGKLQAQTLTDIIQRPDEMGEFLSLYWKEGKTPLSNQVKKGLANAFSKFNEYSLAKWDKNNAAVKLRDVMFLTHPRPKSPEQEILFKKIANDQLETPDTWETQLSGGADKRETFTRLMLEKKLGALAFLRNLRNMTNAGVPESDIREYASQLDVTKVLPFRYIAAAKVCPQFEDMLEDMMLRSLSTQEKLPGKTLLLVDVSGSMFGARVSSKSDLDRFDAAAALAMLCREVCSSVDIYSFSYKAVRVAPRHGFALRDAISNSQKHGGTNLGLALTQLKALGNEYDRIIVFTDEQTHDAVDAPFNGAKGYVINVAAYQNGINHSAWTTVSGFSEAVIDYIFAVEKEDTL
jgi:hypothetical protein